MANLKNYLTDENMTARAFAVLIGKSEGFVSELARGLKQPGLELAHQIEVATAGKVPTESWLKTEPKKD